jgi:hypothetical membrane protein
MALELDRPVGRSVAERDGGRGAAGRAAGWIPPAVVLGLSVLAPVVLVVGVLLAQALQRVGGYDPVRQTVSTLAGRGATDRWAMTATFIVLGLLYVVVAAGLRAVPRSARLLMALGAVAIIIVALAPQPARGSSAIHMAAMGVSCGAFLVWPLGLVADRRVDPRLRRQSAVAVLAVAATVAWMCTQAWTDGTWLGAAERVVLLAETVWPVRVAVASWRASTVRRERPPRTEQVTIALAVLPPLLFPVGLVAAQAAQPSLDPLSFSLSALASLAATDRWIMTTTLLVVGALYMLVAAALRQVPTAGRALLGVAGALLVVTTLFPQPVTGNSPAHMVAGGLSWAAFASWPLAVAASPRFDVRLRRASAAMVGLLAVLLAWFAVEMISSGTWYGLSQRITIMMMCVWPLRMAVHAARHRSSSEPGGLGDVVSPRPRRSP